MRTAHQVWSGVFAVTFVLVAAVQCSGADTASTRAGAAAASGPPPFAPTGVVTRFANAANLELADGRRIHVPMLNGTNVVDDIPDEQCRTDAADATVRALLSGKTVRLTAPPRTRDTPSIVPTGYVQADITTGDGRDYATTFEHDYAVEAYQRCAPPPEPTPSYTPAPSPPSDTDVYVENDDTNHRDGAATGGYCRRKRWC